MDNKYKSILVIVVGFLVLGQLFKNIYLTYTALGIGILCVLFDKITDWIVYAWMKLGHVLGWINSRILLSVVFYLVLTPIAFLSALFGRQDNLNKANKKQSTFKERNHRYQKEDLDNVW